jgi:hypothetical protein
MSTVTLSDDALRTIFKDTNASGSQSIRVVPKPGSDGFNQDALIARAPIALANNAAFLALASPTNLQTLAQVQALTRQIDALIRFELTAYSDVSDS